MGETQGRGATANRKGTERSLQLALAAARTAADNKGQGIVVLNLQEQTPLFDYFVLVTGTSGRQLRAMSDEIDRVLQKELGDKRMSISGFNESRWIVLDYGTILVHLFDEATRTYYDLEHLWADAQPLDISSVVPVQSVGHLEGLRAAE